MVLVNDQNLTKDQEGAEPIAKGRNATFTQKCESLCVPLREANSNIEYLKEALEESNRNHKTAVEVLEQTRNDFQRRLMRNARASRGLVEENRYLSQELNEARGQLYEAQSQHFDFGLFNPGGSNESAPRQLPNCIMGGTWLKEPDCHPSIAEAEVMLESRKYQHALIHLDVDVPDTEPIAHHINAVILKACILRNCGAPGRGLGLAEHAVHIADLNHLHSLVSKAQLFRGMCLYDLELYADAAWCFTRAASIQWFARNIPRWTIITERRRIALPAGSAGKQRSLNFQDIPSSTSTGGSRS